MPGFRKKTKRHARRRPINVVASLLTTVNLYWGAASIFSSISGDFTSAAYFIWAALLFDILDGSVARLTKSTSDFGKELDSLSDLVSFGVAPAVLIFSAYLRPEFAENVIAARVGSVVVICYVICAALRLARYNVYQSDRRDVFVGLPSPAAGATLASFLLFAQYYKIDAGLGLLAPITLTLSFLMVSSVKYPKEQFRTYWLSPNHAFRTLVLFVVGIMIFHFARTESPAIVLFPVCAAGVLHGVVNALVRTAAMGAIRRLAGRHSEEEESDSAPAKIGDVR